MKYAVPRIWVLLLALSCLNSFTPASVADAGRSVVSDAPVSASRGEATASALVRLVAQPSRVLPGQNVRLKVKGKSRGCTVKARSLGLKGSLSGQFKSFRVALDSKPGKHTLRLKCRAGTDSGTVRVRIQQVAAGVGTQDAVDCTYGCGGGSNPFPEGQCTFHAYERRSDIYNTAVAQGQPRTGWHGYMWGSRARAAGFAVDGRPRIGDLAVYTREYFGGPINDNKGGQYGHVAYVTAVAGDNYTVTERNYAGNPNITTHTYRLRPGVEFVHQRGETPVPTPTPTPTTAPTAGMHFSDFVGNDQVLRISLWTGSNWRTDNLGQSVATGTSPSSYLGPNGQHFVYYVGADGSLRVSHWAGSNWQTDNLGQGVAGGTSPSSYLGANGQHFVYFVGADGSLRVSHWAGSNWQTDNLGQGVAAGTRPSAYRG